MLIFIILSLAAAILPKVFIQKTKPSFLKSLPNTVTPLPVTISNALEGVNPRVAKTIHLENARSYLYQAKEIDADLAPRIEKLQKKLDKLVSKRPVLLQRLSQTKRESEKAYIRDSIAKNLFDREQVLHRIRSMQQSSNLMHKQAQDSLAAAKALSP